MLTIMSRQSLSLLFHIRNRELISKRRMGNYISKNSVDLAVGRTLMQYYAKKAAIKGFDKKVQRPVAAPFDHYKAMHGMIIAGDSFNFDFRLE